MLIGVGDTHHDKEKGPGAAAFGVDISDFPGRRDNIIRPQRAVEDIVITRANRLPIRHLQAIGKTALFIELTSVVLPGFAHKRRRCNDIAIFALPSHFAIDVVRIGIIKGEGKFAN